MARLRLPSARLVFDLPQHDALAGKDAVWSCISLALPPPTPGHGNQRHHSTLGIPVFQSSPVFFQESNEGRHRSNGGVHRSKNET
ncbi:hypothetical protein TNCV_4632821 [Trichonephila clavipes]|nr:hypothetical protein TNCV_4632821 [Trichonephila clavipes]